MHRSIRTGFNWLLSRISLDFYDLEGRIHADQVEHSRAAMKEREERRRRVQQIREERARQEASVLSGDGSSTADGRDTRPGRPMGLPPLPLNRLKKSSRVVSQFLFSSSNPK